MRWSDDSQTREARSAGSIASPASQADDQVRADNSSAIPLPWPSFELAWRTSRWWPSLTGWKILAAVVAGVVIVAVQTTLRLADDSTPIPFDGYLLVLAFLMTPILVVLAVVEIWPKGHQRSSCHWAMRVWPDWISVSVAERGRAPSTATIVRSEAGQLTLGFTDGPTSAQGAFGRYLGWATFGAIGAVVMQKASPPRTRPRSASAFSLDGRTVIALARRQARLTWPEAPGDICPLDVLIAWWPLNSRSRAALRDYEATGCGYWNPPYVWPQITKFHPSAAAWTERAPAGSADPTSPMRWT